MAAFKSTVTVSGGTVEGNDSGTANGGGLYLGLPRFAGNDIKKVGN